MKPFDSTSIWRKKISVCSSPRNERRMGLLWRGLQKGLTWEFSKKKSNAKGRFSTCRCSQGRVHSSRPGVVMERRILQCLMWERRGGWSLKMAWHVISKDVQNYLSSHGYEIIVTKDNGLWVTVKDVLVNLEPIFMFSHIPWWFEKGNTNHVIEYIDITELFIIVLFHYFFLSVFITIR